MPRGRDHENAWQNLGLASELAIVGAVDAGLAGAGLFGGPHEIAEIDPLDSRHWQRHLPSYGRRSPFTMSDSVTSMRAPRGAEVHIAFSLARPPRGNRGRGGLINSR